MGQTNAAVSPSLCGPPCPYSSLQLVLPPAPVTGYLANIKFNGTIYTQDTILNVLPGTYPVSFVSLYSSNPGAAFLNWTVVSGSVGSTTSSSTTFTILSGGLSPILTLNVFLVTSVWAGYAVAGHAGTVTQVAGSWVQPTMGCNLTKSSKSGVQFSTWVGLDGLWSTNPYIEQIGTEAVCSPGGATSYGAWYEFGNGVYPGSVAITTITPHPADVFSGTVVYNSATSNFTMSLTDLTTLASFSITQPWSSATESSAECILEQTQPYLASEFWFVGQAGFGSMHTGVTNTCDASVRSALSPFSSFNYLTVEFYSGTSHQQLYPTQLVGGSFNVNHG